MKNEKEKMLKDAGYEERTKKPKKEEAVKTKISTIKNNQSVNKNSDMYEY